MLTLTSADLRILFRVSSAVCSNVAACLLDFPLCGVFSCFAFVRCHLVEQELVLDVGRGIKHSKRWVCVVVGSLFLVSSIVTLCNYA